VKKVFYLIINISLLLILFTSCRLGKQEPVYQIGPAQLTEGQHDIVNLLSRHNQDNVIFSYRTPSAYTSTEFWIDVYSYGQLVERIGGLSTIRTVYDTTSASDSLLVVSVEHGQDNDIRWAMSITDGGGSASHDWVSFQMTETAGGRAFGPMHEPVAIQNGADIILYMKKFSHGNLTTFSDHQLYLEHPEQIARYPYVFLVKARFSAA